MSNTSSTDLECASVSNRFKVDEAVAGAGRFEHRFAASSGSARRRTEHPSQASDRSFALKSLASVPSSGMIASSASSILIEIDRQKTETQAKIKVLLASTQLLDKMKVWVGRVQQGIDLSECQRLQNKIAPFLKADNISQKDELNKVQDLLTRVARTLEPNQSWNNTPASNKHSYQGILGSKYISLINKFTKQGCIQIVDLLIEYAEKAPPADSLIQTLSDYSYTDPVFGSLDIKDQARLLKFVLNSPTPAGTLCDIQKIIAKDGFALPEALKPRFFDAPYLDIYSFYCQLQGISMGPTEKAKVEQN